MKGPDKLGSGTGHGGPFPGSAGALDPNPFFSSHCPSWINFRFRNQSQTMETVQFKHCHSYMCKWISWKSPKYSLPPKHSQLTARENLFRFPPNPDSSKSRYSCVRSQRANPEPHKSAVLPICAENPARRDLGGRIKLYWTGRVRCEGG